MLLLIYLVRQNNFLFNPQQVKRVALVFFYLYCGLNLSFSRNQAKQFVSLNGETNYILKSTDTLFVLSDTTSSKLTPKELKKRKIISAMLAFPFPLGFMGAHRVMLGCKPWVPVVDVATFGGCFGLLPLIDFCAIVFSKDIEQYENNPHIFMWMK